LSITLKPNNTVVIAAKLNAEVSAKTWLAVIVVLDEIVAVLCGNAFPCISIVLSYLKLDGKY